MQTSRVIGPALPQFPSDDQLFLDPIFTKFLKNAQSRFQVSSSSSADGEHETWLELTYQSWSFLSLSLTHRIFRRSAACLLE